MIFFLWARDWWSVVVSLQSFLPRLTLFISFFLSFFLFFFLFFSFLFYTFPFSLPFLSFSFVPSFLSFFLSFFFLSFFLFFFLSFFLSFFRFSFCLSDLTIGRTEKRLSIRPRPFGPLRRVPDHLSPNENLPSDHARLHAPPLHQSSRRTAQLVETKGRFRNFCQSIIRCRNCQWSIIIHVPHPIDKAKSDRWPA